MATKTRNRKGIMLILAVFALCFSLVCIANTSAVQAKTVKATKKYSTAKKIKKGHNKVLFSWDGSHDMFVKFKSPKTGKYTFTFSNLQSDNYYDGLNIESIWLGLAKKSSSRIMTFASKTEGGKGMSTYVCSIDSWGVDPSFSNMYSDMPTRTLTTKIKKGKTVWINFGLGSGHKTNGSFTIDVTRK